MENAKRLTCADHVRRKWFEAIRNKSGPLNYEDPAVVGFMAINKIYQEEALLKGKDPDIIKAERLKKEKKNWDAFKKWYETLDPELYLTELLEHARDFKDEPARAAEYMPWTEKMQTRCRHKTRKEDLGQ